MTQSPHPTRYGRAALSIMLGFLANSIAARPACMSVGADGVRKRGKELCLLLYIHLFSTSKLPLISESTVFSTDDETETEV